MVGTDGPINGQMGSLSLPFQQPLQVLFGVISLLPLLSEIALLAEERVYRALRDRHVPFQSPYLRRDKPVFGERQFFARGRVALASNRGFEPLDLLFEKGHGLVVSQPHVSPEPSLSFESPSAFSHAVELLLEFLDGLRPDTLHGLVDFKGVDHAPTFVNRILERWIHLVPDTPERAA